MTWLHLNTADIEDTSLWDTVDNAAKVAIGTVARTGAKSFELDEAAADADTPKLHATITATSTVYVRCGLYYTALPTSATRIIRLCETATEHVNVYLNTDGTLSVALGTTVLQTGVTELAATTWYCIELRAVIHDAAGTFELRINGAREIRMVNIDTRNGGTNGTINTVKFCGSVSSSNSLLYYDDIAIRNDDWCGQGGLYVAVPSADGDASGWSASSGFAYGCVKELPPTFSSYIYTDSSTLETDHNFAHNGIGGDVYDSIPVVAIYARVRLSELGEANLKTYGKSEDTTGYSATEAITDAESWLKQYLTADPNGSAAWTLGAVNQIYLGVETA